MEGMARQPKPRGGAPASSGVEQRRRSTRPEGGGGRCFSTDQVDGISNTVPLGCLRAVRLNLCVAQIRPIDEKCLPPRARMSKAAMVIRRDSLKKRRMAGLELEQWWRGLYLFLEMPRSRSASGGSAGLVPCPWRPPTSAFARKRAQAYY